ncbi:MAG TPA: polyprenol monophosphomannose synthase [Candidatus Angelobacter sp.]
MVPGSSPELSIVIPTFNERGNIASLVAALGKTLDGLNWEVIFVDDNSPDGTAACIRGIADVDPRVRLIQRLGRRGLSVSCIEGMQATEAPYVAVMDADLQHDETILPSMLERIKSGGFDIVVASRVIAGGGMGEFPRWRVLLSTIGSRISRMVCHCDVSDAMSGFFVIRRTFLQEVIHRLRGTGFKLLVDILASSSRPVRAAEVPYKFRARSWGESKLNFRVELEYLHLLLQKITAKLFRAKDRVSQN